MVNFSLFSFFFVLFVCLFFTWTTPFTSGFISSAGSDDEDDDDDEGLDPAVKVVKEKERRQANNARER